MNGCIKTARKGDLCMMPLTNVSSVSNQLYFSNSEEAGLDVLSRYHVLHSSQESDFKRFTQLAARLFSVPIVLISLIDKEERQWFKAVVGLEFKETEPAMTFCNYAIQSSEMLVVSDALVDPRFALNPLLTSDPYIRFYAGALLQTHNGYNLGTLSIIDTKPRTFSAIDESNLKDLAQLVMEQLELMLVAIQQVEADAELRQREERFSKIFHQGPLATYISTLAEGRFIEVNRRFEELTGVNREQVIGHTDIELGFWVTPDKNAKEERAKILQELTAVGGHLAELEALLRVSNGELRYILISLETIELEGIPCILGMLLDITVRKQSEEELRYWADIFHNTHSGLAVINPTNNTFILVNSAYAKMHGYNNTQEFVGKPTFEMYAPDYQAAFSSYVNQTADEGCEVFESFHQRRDRTVFPVQVDATVVKDETGKARYRVVTVQDISLRHQAEEKLRQSEELFYWLFNNAPASISMARLEDGSYLEVNNSFLRVTGYEREEVIGQVSTNLIWLNVEERTNMVEALREQGYISNWETRFRTKSGVLLDALVTGGVINFKGEAVILNTFLDITERKQAEEALATTQAQLQQSQKLEAIGQLAGGIAHDFNNLLTVILGCSQLSLFSLQTEAVDLVEVMENIGQVIEAGEQAASLTRQLLAFSRKSVLQPKLLNLNKIIIEMSKMFTRIIGEDVILTIHTNPLLAHVEADPSQIQQVLMNLVINARDAMPKGGKLTLETSNVFLDGEYTSSHISIKPGSYVLLTVSDTGQGMDKATVSRIFEPFFTTKELGKGTGLGLATVYGIVKQSEGNILVYSEVGIGTTFKIYLPSLKQASEADKLVEVSGKFWGGHETILIVEDEEGVRKLARRILEQSGYTILEASSGAEAIEICRRKQQQQGSSEVVQLLLTDVVMPSMHGQEVALQLRKLYPHLKVLYMSGYSDRAITQHGVIETGADILEKPFTPIGLLQKVQASLALI